MFWLILLPLIEATRTSTGQRKSNTKYVTDGWSKTFPNTHSLTQCLIVAEKFKRYWKYVNFHEHEFCEVFIWNSTVGSVTQAQGWTMVTQTKEPWLLHQRKVCFGSKDQAPGEFRAKRSGLLSAVKLVYTSGGIECIPDVPRTPFGCAGHDWCTWDKVSVFITDETGGKIYYPTFGTLIDQGFYKLPGYSAWSNELIFQDFQTPVFVTKGMKLKIWYGEDHQVLNDDDNSGETCVDVFLPF